MIPIKLYKRDITAKITFKPLSVIKRLFGIKRELTRENLFEYWERNFNEVFTLKEDTIDVIMVAGYECFFVFIYNGKLFRINNDIIEYLVVNDPSLNSSIPYVYINKHKVVVDYFIENNIQLKIPNWGHYYMYDCNGDMINYKFKTDQLYYKTHFIKYFYDTYDYIMAEAVNCAGDKIQFIMSCPTLYMLDFNKSLVR